MITGFGSCEKFVELNPINLSTEGWFILDRILTSREKSLTSSYEFSSNCLNEILAAYFWPPFFSLSNIYIYNDLDKDYTEESISLLNESIKQGFYPSYELLCIAVIKKYGSKFDEINKSKLTKDVIDKLHQMIKNHKLNDISIFESRFKQLEKVNYLYNFLYQPVKLEDVMNYTCLQDELYQNNDDSRKVTKEFYEGFDINV